MLPSYRLKMCSCFAMWSVLIMILAAPGMAQMLPGPVPEKDDPMEWTTISVGARVHCPGITWGSPDPNSGTVFSNFFRMDFFGKCSANGGPGASGSFPARHGGIAWSGGFSDKWQTTTWLSSAHTGGKSGVFPYTAYPIDRVLVYDPDRVIRACDHYAGGCPPAAYDTSQSGLLPGKLPARVLLFDWGQLRPVHEPSLELTEKPYLKDPTRPDEDNLDSIFLWRDEMTVLSGDGILSDANGWWTAWFGRGDRLLTRLRPNAFTLPGYDPPDDALSDSPPVEIAALDMNPWLDEVMSGYPDLYEPLKLTYSPPLGNRVRNDPENDRRAQVWLQPDYEPQRTPYTLIGQAYQFPLVTGALHTADADICPLTQDAEGNETCLPHPYFGSDAPQAGVPPAERATPVYTFPAPATPDEDVWLDLSATWWDTRTKEEQQAQSGDAGGMEIAHPKGILTSLTPDGASHLEQRLHWRLVTPPNRPDLLETLPATIASGPFTRLVPHARLKISEPGVYDVELSVVGDEGDQLMLDTMQIQVLGVDLDAHWPGAMAEPGPLVSDAEENDALNLIASVNDDDDNDDDIIDNDRAQSPTILPEDDDVMTFVVRALAVNPGVGTLELFAGDGLHVFTADGTQELTLPLSVDLANPTGPLADAVNAEHPRDVTLLVEANIPVERTLVELIYSQDGKELVRDEVHLKVAHPTVKGGFHRGSVKYSKAMPLGADWIVCREFDDTHPLSVFLFADPVYQVMKYKRHEEREYSHEGSRVGMSYFERLAAKWNAFLDAVPFVPKYKAETLLKQFCQATGVPEDMANSEGFVTDPDDPITTGGAYDVIFLVDDENEDKAKTLAFTIIPPGQITGSFPLLDDRNAPYAQEEPLTETTELHETFFRTLGGMRLHVKAALSEELTPYQQYLVGYEWSLAQEAEFAFPTAVWEQLRDELDTKHIPNAIVGKLASILEGNSFQTEQNLVEAIDPAFTGYTITDSVLADEELTQCVAENIFPNYFLTDSGLGRLRYDWNEETKEWDKLDEKTYWSEAAFEEALQETRFPGKTGKEATEKYKYAVHGYRLGRQLFADKDQNPFKDALDPKIYQRLKSYEQGVTICKGYGMDACIKGDTGEGYSFRNEGEITNEQGQPMEAFVEFLAVLKKALKAPKCKGNEASGEFCCENPNNCTFWIVCGDDTACKQDVIETVKHHTSHLNLFSKEIETIKAKAANTIYRPACLNAIVKYGSVGKTGNLYPNYKISMVDSENNLIEAPPLTGEELRGQKEFFTDPLNITDVYWQGKPRADVDEVVTLSLTFGKQTPDNQIEVLGTVPITRRFKSRVLRYITEENTSRMTGDDVSMLQTVLNFLGWEPPLGVDGDFGGGTHRRVIKFKKQNRGDWTHPDSVVDTEAIKILNIHFNDYRQALNAFGWNDGENPDSQYQTLRNSHPDFIKKDAQHDWLRDAAALITNLPANTILPETVYPAGIASAENRLLLKKAAVESKDDVEGCSFVHWTDWKITGSGLGPIGFAQVFPFNSKRYNLNNDDCKIDEHLNLYRPDENLKAGADFFNEVCLSQAFSKWKVGNDDNLALLKKALAYYNAGGKPAILKAHSWENILTTSGHYDINISYVARFFMCPRSLSGECDGGCTWWP